MNSDSIIDKDGLPGSVVAKDAYRFSLNYFNGDYEGIGAEARIAFPAHSSHMTGHLNEYRPLYNGNISSMVVGIPKLGETKLYNYGYDQLNRIVSMDAWGGYNTAVLSWQDMAISDEYKERVAYDGNGNILKYLRNGAGTTLAMDSLSYGYQQDINGHLENNRLRHVRDGIGDGNYAVDIDSQGDDNYEYDAIGNLVKDTKEGITSIEWTVYGKIKRITKANGTIISYSYDVTGNRISKTITEGENTTTTWYTRDAQGNTMAVFKEQSSTLALNEHHLYGSSRLGVWDRDIDMSGTLLTNNQLERGNKYFELSNHLGNVLATVSDKKTAVDTDTDGYIDFYLPDVVTARDYYPFGMQMVGRKFDAGKYRYGFNGKENDNEIKGEGNQQDYGLRIYDPRLGKFLSVDPLTKSYCELTPYQFASNSPIRAIDLDGAEARDAVTGQVLTQFGSPASVSGYKSWMDLMTINSNSKQIYDEANSRLYTWINGYTKVKKQTLAGAYSKTISVDYYSVDISKLPPAFATAAELFTHIRKNFADFMKGGGTSMSPLTSTEETQWESNSPVSSVMHFDVYQNGINTEDFNVITIETTSDYWLFQTVRTTSLQDPAINEDREHPLGGVRQFGLIDNQNASFTFYTRGVDSPYGFLDTKLQDKIFKGAKKLWNAVMKNVADYINAIGGEAKVGGDTQQKYHWENDLSEADREKVRAQKEN